MARPAGKAPRPRLTRLWVLTLLLAACALGLTDRSQPPPSIHIGEEELARLQEAAPAPGSEYRLPMLPHLVGEKLEFEFGWQGIRAAKGNIRVEAIDTENGVDYRIAGTAVTRGIVEKLWDMRTETESIVDGETLVLKRNVYDMREDDEWERREVIFDPAARMAHYRREESDREDVRVKELPMEAPLEPLSVGYFLRVLDIEAGESPSVTILADDNPYLIRFEYQGRDVVEVRAGRFRALRLRPVVIRVDKQEHRARETTLWVSDDYWHIPLKVQSRVKVGHVTGELIDYTPPTSVAEASD